MTKIAVTPNQNQLFNIDSSQPKKQSLSNNRVQSIKNRVKPNEINFRKFKAFISSKKNNKSTPSTSKNTIRLNPLRLKKLRRKKYTLNPLRRKQHLQSKSHNYKKNHPTQTKVRSSRIENKDFAQPTKHQIDGLNSKLERSPSKTQVNQSSIENKDCSQTTTDQNKSSWLNNYLETHNLNKNKPNEFTEILLKMDSQNKFKGYETNRLTEKLDDFKKSISWHSYEQGKDFVTGENRLYSNIIEELTKGEHTPKTLQCILRDSAGLLKDKLHHEATKEFFNFLNTLKTLENTNINVETIKTIVNNIESQFIEEVTQRRDRANNRKDTWEAFRIEFGGLSANK